MENLKNMIMADGRRKILKEQTIEGDEIYLENTTAKVVRGTNVVQARKKGWTTKSLNQRPTFACISYLSSIVYE